MSKRKFKKGAPVMCVDDFLKHDWFIVCEKTYNAGWCRSWSLTLAQRYVKDAFIAERLTNEEFYAGKSDEQLATIVGEEQLCDYCPIPDELKGVHCYGGEPVMCEGSCCDEALNRWKEEYVE